MVMSVTGLEITIRPNVAHVSFNWYDLNGYFSFEKCAQAHEHTHLYNEHTHIDVVQTHTTLTFIFILCTYTHKDVFTVDRATNAHKHHKHFKTN